MNRDMDELKQQIDALTQKLGEKEAELLLMKRDLLLLTEKFERLKEEQQIREIEKQAAIMPQPETPVAAEPIQPTIAPEPQPEPQKVTEPKKEVIETVAPAEHAAIKRTIEALAKEAAVPRGLTPEQRFQSKPTLVDKVNRQRVHDLKGSLGINERFLYANELFRGDMGAFTRALEELNHLESGQDAERLMNEDLAEKYSWNEESETVIAFKSLVSRRFS